MFKLLIMFLESAFWNKKNSFICVIDIKKMGSLYPKYIIMKLIVYVTRNISIIWKIALFYDP